METSMSSIFSLLSKDDWIYTGILLSSFLISWILRLQKSQFLLAYGGGPIGFAMALIVLGRKICYSIPIALFVAFCIKFAPRKQLTIIVFVSSFVYLMFIRYLHYFFDVEELASQANVVQLIMTLRVIGLAFEISDFRYAKAHPESVTKPKRFLEEEPTFLDILNYFYHFAGLFTGPYYTYQMLLDSQDPVLFTKWSPLSEIRERALRLCWSAPLFIIFNKLYPLDGLRSDAVWGMSFPYRILYAAAVFVVFRARVYSAWAVAESMCVTIGLGIYPADSKPRTVVGPTDLGKYKELKGRADVEYNSEAIVNLDIPEIEMSDGFRSGIRAWNKSVQSWLALYVHSRVSRMYRVELTMFVSALWHGTYAGYFMYVYFFSRTSIFFTLRSRGFDMLATGFLLKNFQDTHSKKSQKKKELKKEL
ncbi:MBOAT family protein [Oesophagostomum dentatum]|uniref:Lysophospholipid acyltransferase 7 n=1 Tax=Oesophagostomum dentatum TaxID=61180 RepID=A0A0B1SND7_OESDE|nr:MBOAT family protein [Oesophagostomum dentatum]